MKKVFLFFFIMLPSGIFSQGDYNQIYFKHYKVEDGLSQSWVQCIYQDYLGFMWVGTGDGLNRFDGYEFKVYKHNPKSKTSIKNNNITCIREDFENNLWIATSTGLCLFNREHENFIYEESWPELYITTILPVKEGLLLATDQGLFQLSQQSHQIERLKINNENILTELYISSLKKDYLGNIWIGTLDGVFIIDGSKKNLTHFTLNSNSQNRISTIETDSKNTIWIGTETDGLFRVQYIDNQAKVTNHLSGEDEFSEIENGVIRAIQEDINGILWVSVENTGVSLIDIEQKDTKDLVIATTKHEARNQNGLSSNSIFAIYRDNRDDLWLGTYGGGINFYNHKGINFLHYRNSPQDQYSLINNDVNFFYEYRDHIYIGTQGGLSIFDPQSQSFENFTKVNNNPGKKKSDAVWSITANNNGGILIGTWAGGVSVFDPATKKFESFLPEIFAQSNIFSIIQDSENIIWIATMGSGLYSYNPVTEEIKNYITDINDPYSISNNWVRQVFENSRNELWVSTSSSLDLFDRSSDKFLHFTSNINDTTSISGRGAYIIFEDSKKNMWFGTDAGLNHFIREDSSFAYYQEDDGLPNNSVKGIVEDSKGNLWLGTNKGISKMVNGIQTPIHPDFRNFDVSDGLQGNEFNRKSALSTKDGTMYFGGTNGFNIFIPDSLQKNDFIPRVVFTNFLLSNKEVQYNAPDSPINKHISITDEIKLKFSQSAFTIEYSALSYINPKKNQYAYILEGFDPEESGWNEVGNQRSANYTNLNPGNYVFKVKASNNDGTWSQTSTDIKITILPPWYNTKLAYLFYLIFIASLIYALRRLVLMRLKLEHEIELKQLEKDNLDEVHKVKTRFFTNISHEFRTPLTLIIAPLEKILKNTSFQPDVNHQLQVMLKNARRMLRLINQFMDMSKIEAGYLKMAIHEGNIAKYIHTISDIFKYQAEEKQIKYKYICSHENLIGWFDSDKIEKILYNLLSNAIKFTSEGKTVSMEVKFNLLTKNISDYPGYVEFWIKDEGIGMKEDEAEKIFTRFYQASSSKSSKYSGTGIGLSLVNGLIQKYNGEIKFSTKYGQGSTFYFRLPYARHLFNEKDIINKTEEEYLSKLEPAIVPASSAPEKKLFTEQTSYKDLPLMLIVEDNLDLISYLTEHFQKEFRVINAVNGREGIEAARKHNPNLIISDIMMPETDGIELCKTLKSNEKTSHIPIILLTAKASDETHVEGLDTGADSFLAKPFNIEVLEARVTNLLHSRKKLRELFVQKINLEPKDIAITSVDAKFLQKAMDLVDKNIANTEFSTEMMSSELGMSRASLHRKLIALADMPPSSFIRTMRIKRAVKLLVEGQKTVSEVLYEVGIKSRSYFTKSFKETYGMSPTEYVNAEKRKIKDQEK